MFIDTSLPDGTYKFQARGNYWLAQRTAWKNEDNQTTRYFVKEGIEPYKEVNTEAILKLLEA